MSIEMLPPEVEELLEGEDEVDPSPDPSAEPETEAEADLGRDERKPRFSSRDWLSLADDGEGSLLFSSKDSSFRMRDGMKWLLALPFLELAWRQPGVVRSRVNLACLATREQTRQTCCCDRVDGF